MTGGRGESRIHQRQQPSGLQRSRQRDDVLGRARDRSEGDLGSIRGDADPPIMA
jgi:hypothetical protein